MGNLGQREKYLIIVMGILLIILALYLLGIRPLTAKNYDLEVEKQQLQARLDYYKALQQSNDEMLSEIHALEGQISDIEETFVPVINTEALEQYIMNIFESNDCPYLVGISTENVQSPAFTLPDGSVADETLNIKRVAVVYSTTDGFNVPEYNRDQSLIDPETGRVTENQEEVDAILEGMTWQGMESIVGYDEFIASLNVIKDENPSCIKISEIRVDTVAGYKLMSATIDFYSANLINRVSPATSSAPYVTWAGAASYPTGAGFIGLPFYVDNPDSAWYGFYMPLADATSTDRPFASAFSAAYFSANANATGLPGFLELDEDAGNNNQGADDQGEDLGEDA